MAELFADLSVDGLGPVLAMLGRFGNPNDAADGLAAIGGLIENQTKHRIAFEKRSPEGQPWKAWSPAYAASRHHGHSLLRAGDHLMGDIHWEMDGSVLAIGTNLVYGAIHQWGGLPGMRPGTANIPAREYLGLSAENIVEIDEAMRDWAEGLMQ